MKWILRTAVSLTMLIAVNAVSAQTKSSRSTAASAATRYFQLTLDLKFGAMGEQQAITQTITTEVAVHGDIPGSCKARMVSQTPEGSGVGTKYIEVGTKFDADQIHTEGDGMALHFVLSASRPLKMIKYKTKEGTEMEEPVITDRTVELFVKVPLGQTTVVFDSSTKSPAALKPLDGHSKNDGTASESAEMPRADQPMVIAIGLRELK